MTMSSHVQSVLHHRRRLAGIVSAALLVVALVAAGWFYSRHRKTNAVVEQKLQVSKQLLLDRKEAARAEQILREVLSERPENATAWHHLGGALLLQSRDDESIQAFKEALRHQPDLAKAFSALGILYFRRGNRELATTYLQMASRLEPTREDLLSLIESVNGRGPARRHAP